MKPIREHIGTTIEDTREAHPAYAMIVAGRVQGAATLAGSDFKHQNYVTIELRHAHLSRSLSNDRWHASGSIVRLAMSEAQWATFVSSMNVGFGVPCTLQWTEKDGRIPNIEALNDRAEQFKGEVSDLLRDAMSSLQEAHDAAPTKKLKAKIATAMARLQGGVPFVEDQFAEHMENTVEKAKIEVNAYVTGAVQRAGLEAMNADVVLLRDSKDPNAQEA